MAINLSGLVHPRVQQYCFPLLESSAYKHAALEAMTHVENALRERGLAPADKYGQDLVNWVLGAGHHITLLVPLGDQLQEQARLLFRGAFAYYRNYAAHDGAMIDERTCVRILILASELLDLVDASTRSYERIGGLDGLVELRLFKDRQQITSLLHFLNGNTVVESDFGALHEALFEQGFTETQMDTLFEYGLLKYHESEVPGATPTDWILVGFIDLTALGVRALEGGV